jgi:hypothetical protein
VARSGLDVTVSGEGPEAGSREHGNEHLGPIEGGEFDLLSDYQLLNKDSAPWR